MPYRFTCRSCHDFIYLEEIADVNTLYKCTICDTDNWIDSSWHELEEIDLNVFAEKPTNPKEIPRNIKSTKSTGTLSEKFRGLETFKFVLIMIGVLYTGGYVLLFLNLPYDTPDVLGFSILIGGGFGVFLSWYGIMNISRIISFLFELDERKSDKE